MDVSTARQIAHYSHLQERDRFGEPRIEHVERVAACVPADARVAAFLHDVLEWTPTGMPELLAAGLSADERHVLELLTREPDESFEAHALRVAVAAGHDGELARVIRLADLDDHLTHRDAPDGAPPYAWARRRIAVAHETRQSVAGAT
jgi:hypothetical protein